MVKHQLRSEIHKRSTIPLLPVLGTGLTRIFLKAGAVNPATIYTCSSTFLMWEQNNLSLWQHYLEFLLRIILIRARIETKPRQWASPFVVTASVIDQSCWCNGGRVWVHLRNCSAFNQILRTAIETTLIPVASMWSHRPSLPRHRRSTKLLSNLGIIWANCDGLRVKINKIVNGIGRKNIKIVAIQKMKLGNTCRVQSCNGCNQT